MQTFFQYPSKLQPFRIFSMEHLITMAIILILCILLSFLKNWNRRGIRLILAVWLTVFEAAQHLWLVREHAWSAKHDLPLQLSDLSVILAVVMLLSKSNKLFQFLYFAGLGSSIQAIVTPDLGRFSFPHFQYIEFFATHGGVVLACLLMAWAYHSKPTVRSLWVTVLIVNLYAGCIYFINKALGANYLYIMKKPESASLLNYLGPWPWYLGSMEMAMIASFYILFLPFWKRKQ